MRLAVVGAGLAGLTTAYLATRAHPQLEVIVLEAGDAPGGKARSSRMDGFVFDWGPSGFLTNVDEALDLVLSLGLGDRLRPASDEAARRYLYHDGFLRPLPTSLGSFLHSDLLSPPGKLRLLSEVLVGVRIRREESVHDFVARHFGFEAARVFAGAFVADVTAGDARETSLDALFPRLRKLEDGHGSLLRGLAAARRAQSRAAGPPGEARDGRLTGFDGGFQTLVDSLAAALGTRLRTGARVVGLHDRGRPGDGPMTLRLADADHGSDAEVEADAVALAVPAFRCAELLGPSAPAAAAALSGIRYADVAVVALGYDRIDVPRLLDGWGMLVPRGEGVRALSVSWNSVAFPGQAPPGKVALRVIGGGTLDPGLVALDDGALLVAVRRDLERSMGIVADPEALFIVRWQRGLPQYTLGHADRLEAAGRALQARWPRLELVGDYLTGVGVNDVVREARAAAARLTGVPRI